MKICIYGAGAMGTSLGMLLHEKGDEPLLVTRNAAHVDAMREKGYSACLPSEMTGEYDVIFLSTKQRENGEIARFLLPYLKGDGALVTVQNGLPEAGLAEVVGADRVYGCALGWGAELLSPGTVRVTSEQQSLAVGAYGKGEKLDEIAAYLRRGVEVTVGNLNEIRYSKLVVNAAFSTLSAISGLTFGELAKKHKKPALAMMRETVRVARAEGCKRLVQSGHDLLKYAESPFAGLLLPHAMRRHAAIRSGMLRDISAGRRCDVDFVAGAVVKAGERRGIAVPTLRRATELVHEIENGLAELSPETLTLLYES